jgi:hypothetical protein
MDSDKTAPPISIKSQIEFSKSTDFDSAYANNVALESSFWDLKLIFGQNDQQAGPQAVVQHTAITLPWNQVKVLKYFLDSNIATYEAVNGRIVIAPNIIPAVPAEPPKDFIKENPNAEEIFAALKDNYDAFIAANPEAAPQTKVKNK